MDRIDLHINTLENYADKAMLFTHLRARQNPSSSEAMRDQIVKARYFSLERNKKFGVEFNRDLTAQMLVEASGLTSEDFKRIINRVVPQSASPRSMMRSLRVARTLADLSYLDKITEAHVEKAWQWQPESAARERGDHTLGITI